MTHSQPCRSAAAILLLILSFGVLFSAERKVKSTVTAATVFSDRALISRRAQEQLPVGEHTIVFSDLPATLLDQSVRVSGISEGEGKILDVKVETVFLDTIPEQRIGDLQRRLKALKAEQQVLLHRMAIFQAQRGFIDTVRITYAKGTRTTSSTGAIALEDLDKMLSFFEKNLASVYANMREVQEKEETVREKIVAVEREVQQSQAYSPKSQKQVAVVMRTDRGGKTTLDLTYMITGATWTPSYEVRVASGSNEIQLISAATVTQNTGENWEAIALTLSTAQPAAGGTPPEMRPWYIDEGKWQPRPFSQRPSVAVQKKEMGSGNTLRGLVTSLKDGSPLVGANVAIEGTMMGTATNVEGRYVIANVPSGTYRVKALYIGFSPYTVSDVRIDPNQTAVVDFQVSDFPLQMEEVTVTAQRPLISRSTTSSVILGEVARVQAQPTSYSFNIPSKATIPSDNVPHKVTIAMVNLPAKLSYTAVPRFSRSAYLKATVNNTSEYPFLPGPMNVFFENAFVASSEVNQVLPGEKFEAGLGVDEGVRLERKLINRFTESTGTFTRKKRVTYDYAIKVENAKQVQVDLQLRDQIPISRNENITVEMIEPSSKESKPDENGFLIWSLSLNPGEKREVKLRFSVEFPSDLSVAGLE